MHENAISNKHVMNGKERQKGKEKKRKGYILWYRNEMNCENAISNKHLMNGKERQKRKGYILWYQNEMN